MTGDILSDLLRAVRLRGAVYYSIEGREPWAAGAPVSRELIPAVLPGVEHLIEFHGIARGSCWARAAGEPALRLEAGDVILFPQGDAHVLASAPALEAAPVDMGLYFTPRPSQLPFVLGVGERGVTTARLDGGGPDSTHVVCGFLGCDARPFNPLLAALPRVLPVRGVAAAAGSWIGTFLRTAVEESNHRRPGGEAVLERMSEMMFVDVLRRYVDALPADQTGWLAGLRDPAVGRVLARLHREPGAPWTIERLAEEAAVSRSTLHERFVHFVGQPPMQYLAQWRMQVAAGWLRDTDAKVIDVALEVGYENETAFARAFRRSVGESPGAWRRARRARPEATRLRLAGRSGARGRADPATAPR